ncbi:hypothetical protein N9600_02030 [Flavobacteriaceae bacterium]|nr:hypothetical protein [Flavobacteriaceae bacterium]
MPNETINILVRQKNEFYNGEESEYSIVYYASTGLISEDDELIENDEGSREIIVDWCLDKNEEYVKSPKDYEFYETVEDDVYYWEELESVWEKDLIKYAKNDNELNEINIVQFKDWFDIPEKK